MNTQNPPSPFAALLERFTVFPDEDGRPDLPELSSSPLFSQNGHPAPWASAPPSSGSRTSSPVLQLRATETGGAYIDGREFAKNNKLTLGGKGNLPTGARREKEGRRSFVVPFRWRTQADVPPDNALSFKVKLTVVDASTQQIYTTHDVEDPEVLADDASNAPGYDLMVWTDSDWFCPSSPDGRAKWNYKHLNFFFEVVAKEAGREVVWAAHSPKFLMMSCRSGKRRSSGAAAGSRNKRARTEPKGVAESGGRREHDADVGDRATGPQSPRTETDAAQRPSREWHALVLQIAQDAKCPKDMQEYLESAVTNDDVLHKFKRDRNLAHVLCQGVNILFPSDDLVCRTLDAIASGSSVADLTAALLERSSDGVLPVARAVYKRRTATAAWIVDHVRSSTRDDTVALNMLNNRSKRESTIVHAAASGGNPAFVEHFLNCEWIDGLFKQCLLTAEAVAGPALATPWEIAEHKKRECSSPRQSQPFRQVAALIDAFLAMTHEDRS